MLAKVYMIRAMCLFLLSSCEKNEICLEALEDKWEHALDNNKDEAGLAIDV